MRRGSVYTGRKRVSETERKIDIYIHIYRGRGIKIKSASHRFANRKAAILAIWIKLRTQMILINNRFTVSKMRLW